MALQSDEGRRSGNAADPWCAPAPAENPFKMHPTPVEKGHLLIIPIFAIFSLI